MIRVEVYDGKYMFLYDEGKSCKVSILRNGETWLEDKDLVGNNAIMQLIVAYNDLKTEHEQLLEAVEGLSTQIDQANQRLSAMHEVKDLDKPVSPEMIEKFSVQE